MANTSAFLGARQGAQRRFKQCVFFACEGLVAFFDERTSNDHYKVLLPDDLVERSLALVRKSKTGSKADMKPWQRQEQAALEKFAQDAKEVQAEARAMGDPSDPAVQAYWRRHRRQSTVSFSQVRLHPGIDPEGYPDLPEIDLGPITGRTAAVDAEIPHIHQSPRRKNRGSKLIFDPSVL